MRQILTDHFRRRQAVKRGGDRVRVTLQDERLPQAESDREADVIDLVSSLEKLEGLNPRHANVVTLKFFGGLTVPEIAEELGVSVSTVEQDWRMARAWLLTELEADES